MKLTNDSKLPPGLKVLLMDTFKCSICHDLITPPVAYSRCCQSIVGCETCIDAWYSGEDGRLKSCPLCRRERSSGETARLNGISDFLENIRGVFVDNKDDAPATSVPPAPTASAISGLNRGLEDEADFDDNSDYNFS